MKLAGVVLMLAGVAALIYGGFSYTSHKKAIDMGPIQVQSSQHHYVPLPPVLGIAFLAGGALVYFGGRSRA